MPRRRGKKAKLASSSPSCLYILLALLVVSALLNGLEQLSDTAKILAALALAALSASFLFLRQRSASRRRERWTRAIETLGVPVPPGTLTTIAPFIYLSPRELEVFASNLFSRMGYHAQVTGHSADHGIDVRLQAPSGELAIAQCKQWSRAVGEGGCQGPLWRHHP